MASKKKTSPKAQLHKELFLKTETRCPICDSNLHIKATTYRTKKVILEEQECIHCQIPINQWEYRVN